MEFKSFGGVAYANNGVVGVFKQGNQQAYPVYHKRGCRMVASHVTDVKNGLNTVCVAESFENDLFSESLEYALHRLLRGSDDSTDDETRGTILHSMVVLPAVSMPFVDFIQISRELLTLNVNLVTSISFLSVLVLHISLLALTFGRELVDQFSTSVNLDTAIDVTHVNEVVCHGIK
eukprot:gb/GECG01008754.1/.p1 GENE.gb/GECG01008754.1/~~gb/GECG01008754.1/.p1  ORF type:complete len:176 (+),score=14.27 gb/GECG01008754.1/:1-528(+)